ncbi:MAG: hypothetical protein LBL39_00610, partial [Planctomycetaceae bacterium]|nr:hypothetical protein [Planctomycetaceae bacterium]
MSFLSLKKKSRRFIMKNLDCVKVMLVVMFFGVLCSAPILAQAQDAPAENAEATPIKGGKVTPIKGGYHVEWEGLADIGSFRLKNNLSGKFNVQFDIPLSEIDAKPRTLDNPD